jgi:prepilin-type N-terminal cleavage/methylation domain-containing protein
MRRGFTLLELLVVVALIALLAAFFVPTLRSNYEKKMRIGCTNNLRTFGLAAIQYADDKRFFPHNGKLSKVDGDGMNGTSNHQTKIVRALQWYGYHDEPENWICPASSDSAPEPSAQVRTWSWGGGERGSLTESPFVHDADDPALIATAELSYGWTRRGEGG